MKNPNDYAARANIMWASTQALNHWLSQGVTVDWATHYIGHELTAYLGMDHGRTLACIQPRVLTYNFEAKKAKLAQMGRRVFNLEGEDEVNIMLNQSNILVEIFLIYHLISIQRFLTYTKLY